MAALIDSTARRVRVNVRLLIEEAKISCTSRMLLCLDRGQRLVYILGEILDVGDAVGAKLLEISADNFRQRLSRARRELHSFMNDKCGLVNPANPCRCAKKTRGFMQAGYVDPAKLLFATSSSKQSITASMSWALKRSTYARSSLSSLFMGFSTLLAFCLSYVARAPYRSPGRRSSK